MPTVWAWGLLTVPYDGTNYKEYENWTYLGNPTTYPSWHSGTVITLNLTSWKTAIAQMPHFWAPARKWHIAEFIVENKTWAAQEIANYYNGIKSKYWIS